ncbi:hypothetical protein CEP53_000891 [Fusarium sp. AF-6]|nr:hypothetical protein CEP53_000891 [Fusarium sp. AF-6]
MSPNVDFVPVQAAFSISALDITQSGDVIIRGREERFGDSRLRDSLPPQEPSTARVLVLESPFSVKNPGVEENMPNWFDLSNWFDQFKETQPPRPFSHEPLENLWSGLGSNDPTMAFWVSDYLMREKKTFNSSETLMDLSPYLQRGYIQYGRGEWLTIYMWICMSSIHVEFLQDNRVQITCRFPIIPDQYQNQDSDRLEVYVDPTTGTPSPLKRHFLRLLFSQESATKILLPTAEIASMAVTLDVLRASVLCWTQFLVSLIRDLYKNRRQLESSRSQPSYNIESIQPDISHLELMLRYTYASFLLKVQDRDDVDVVKLKWLELEIDTRLRGLQIHVQHWLSMVDRMADISSASADERKAQSVNRLTLLAAIFLPVGLASSLLSMNVRAADLGPLWYDYFGLALIIMALVALLYLCILLHDRVRTVDWGRDTDLRVIQLLQ